MLPRRDKDLRAGQPKCTVVLGLRLCPHEPQIRSALGRGKAHRPRPLPGGEARQELRLERLGAVRRTRTVRAMGQPGIHGKGHVRRRKHLLDEERQGARQALAPMVRVAGQRAPPAIDETRISGLEPFGGSHLAVVEMATFLVPRRIQRLQHFGGELTRFVEDRFDEIRGQHLERAAILQNRGIAELLE